MPGLRTSAEELALRRQNRRTTGLLGGATTASTPDDSVARHLLAPHPANWRSTIGDVSDLVQSMRNVGILEPLVVTPRAAHLSAWPQHADAIGDAAYVVVCGHRRLIAAADADLLTVPVVIRPELSADGRDIEAMVVENARRQNFDPLDEARAFEELVRRGRRQEEIAAAVGCTQSHVSKRLQLLRLAEPVRDAVAAGRLRVRDALTIGRLGPEYQVAAWEEAWKATQAERLDADPEVDEPAEEPVARTATVAAGVARQRQRQAVAQRTAESQARAAADNIPLIDAGAQFGEAAWRHRLDTDEAVARARAAGTLRGAIDETGGLYLLTTDLAAVDPPAPAAAPAPVSPTATPDDAPAAARARPIPSQKTDPAAAELAQAGRARHAACVRLARRKPSATEALRRLAGAVVTLTPSREALRLAHQWLQEAGVAGDADPARYADTVAAADSDEAVTFAVAVVLAADELHTRRAQQEWDARAAAHVRQLMTAAGYVPTAIETRLLQAQ